MNYTTRPILWIVLVVPRYPLPSICTPCARVYRYVSRLCLAPRWIALSLDHVNWGRLIIATFREAISIVTVEDLRDRDKLVRWLSRDNLVNQARHTFQSTHKYGCYLLIRTRFALLCSYQLYFLGFTLSPHFSIHVYISNFSPLLFPSILLRFFLFLYSVPAIPHWPSEPLRSQSKFSESTRSLSFFFFFLRSK